MNEFLMQFVHLRVVDDESRRGLEYNLDRCEGALMALEHYIGLDDVIPEAVGIWGTQPMVEFRVDGHSGVFHLLECTHHPVNAPIQVRYIADYNFGTVVDCWPDILGGNYYLLDI